MGRWFRSSLEIGLIKSSSPLLGRAGPRQFCCLRQRAKKVFTLPSQDPHFEKSCCPTQTQILSYSWCCLKEVASPCCTAGPGLTSQSHPFPGSIFIWSSPSCSSSRPFSVSKSPAEVGGPIHRGPRSLKSGCHLIPAVAGMIAGLLLATS